MAKEQQDAAATPAPAKPSKRKKEFKKKRERRVVPHGVVCIQATFNNTIVTITDPNGRAVCWSSAGGVGFKGSRKGTPYAAQQAAVAAASVARDHYGMKSVEVRVRVIPDTSFGASVVLWKNDGSVDRLQGALEGDTLVIPVASFDGVWRAMVVVSHRSPGRHDPDSMQYFATRDAQISVQPATIPDPDPDGGTTVDEGVGPDTFIPVPDAAFGGTGHDAGRDLGLLPAPRGCACAFGAPRPEPAGWRILCVLAFLVARAQRRAGRTGTPR